MYPDKNSWVVFKALFQDLSTRILKRGNLRANSVNHCKAVSVSAIIQYMGVTKLYDKNIKNIQFSIKLNRLVTFEQSIIWVLDVPTPWSCP